MLPVADLPSLITLKRPGSTVVNGDFSGTLTTLGTMYVRITRAQRYGLDAHAEAGTRSLSQFLVMANLSGAANSSNLIPNKGDYLDYGSERYVVVLNDDKPGGVLNSHQEIYVNLVE